MVRMKRVLFVIVPCLLLLFGVLASASAAVPAYSFQSCTPGQSLSAYNTQCGTSIQQPAALTSLLQNCASGQCLSPQSATSAFQQTSLTSLLQNCASGQCLGATNSQQCGTNNVQSYFSSWLNSFSAAR